MPKITSNNTKIDEDKNKSTVSSKIGSENEKNSDNAGVTKLYQYIH